jgi:hypothetical protein
MLVTMRGVATEGHPYNLGEASYLIPTSPCTDWINFSES